MSNLRTESTMLFLLNNVVFFTYKGLSEAKVDKIKEGVLKLCGPNAGFCTALQEHTTDRIKENLRGSQDDTSSLPVAHA
jgi:hypothetical protein